MIRTILNRNYTSGTNISMKKHITFKSFTTRVWQCHLQTDIIINPQPANLGTDNIKQFQ